MPLPHQRLCNGHKRDGAPCTNVAVRGNAKCRMHGGQSLSGLASPRLITGKYSKVLPARLATKYLEAKNSPRLLSLADDIAAAEARLMDLFQRVDSGESGALWHSLGATLDAFNTALAKNDLPAMHAHLATIRSTVTQGCDDSTGWSEIQDLWKTRCLLTQTEMKTLVTMQQMVTTEQLMQMFGIISHAIQEAVTTYAHPEACRKILDTLSVEFQRISTLEEAKGA
jgi:hypothetical protein